MNTALADVSISSQAYTEIYNHSMKSKALVGNKYVG
jgi:hypothetical protein